MAIQATSDPSAASASIRSVRIEAASRDEGEVETFGLRRLDSATACVRIETCSATRCDLPRIVEAPEVDTARRVAGALESARDDPPYEHALPVLLWLLRP